MRHGFSDQSLFEITNDDVIRFLNQSVARLADMLKPEWLEYEKKCAPEHWKRNAAFHLNQNIDSVVRDLGGGAVTEEQKDSAREVLAKARELVRSIQ